MKYISHTVPTSFSFSHSMLHIEFRGKFSVIENERGQRLKIKIECQETEKFISKMCKKMIKRGV